MQHLGGASQELVRRLLPPRLADLIRQLRDQDEPRWTLGPPWDLRAVAFPGQSPARPAVDILFGVRLHRARTRQDSRAVTFILPVCYQW
jgi:hypothetical protein